MGSVSVDSWASTFSFKDAYKHAMSSFYIADGSKWTACEMANTFIRTNMMYFYEHYKEGSTKAWYYFGIAMHTLQDSTSPVHAGFADYSFYEQLLLHGPFTEGEEDITPEIKAKTVIGMIKVYREAKDGKYIDAFDCRGCGR